MAIRIKTHPEQVSELLEHPYLTKRADIPPMIPIPSQRLSTKVARPLSPSILQDILFLAFVAGEFFLCESPKAIEKRLYSRQPCWEQQWANMLSGWQRDMELDWEDMEVLDVLVSGLSLKDSEYSREEKLSAKLTRQRHLVGTALSRV